MFSYNEREPWLWATYAHIVSYPSNLNWWNASSTVRQQVHRGRRPPDFENTLRHSSAYFGQIETRYVSLPCSLTHKILPLIRWNSPATLSPINFSQVCPAVNRTSPSSIRLLPCYLNSPWNVECHHANITLLSASNDYVVIQFCNSYFRVRLLLIQLNSVTLSE